MGYYCRGNELLVKCSVLSTTLITHDILDHSRDTSYMYNVPQVLLPIPKTLSLLALTSNREYPLIPYGN